jgi:hypothetical protein
VKEVSEWANGTIEGNGIWKSEGVTRRFKAAQYIYDTDNLLQIPDRCDVFLSFGQELFRNT